ncbi:MAG: 16S rRNA (uracil(1498)-N(3))-methyltransferase [Planctomycetes bacterium]|nr:16S rRNA (uracil(1498)-N(3))-methyltransferase [Planctomycetota bacterium]MBI3846803.1 16S rRNA (uracil(1498)-N(3))-methyltransferase [Planctomycetota bacterium]
MTERFFIDEDAGDVGSRVVLPRDESAHLVRVMRARPGDEVVVFNEHGVEWRCRLESFAQREATLTVLARAAVDREIGVEVTIASSPPKGPRLRDLVRQLAELGVRRLVPIETERGSSIGRLGGDAERAALRRIAIEAAKQSGRNRLLEIADSPAVPIAIALATLDGTRFIAVPSRDASPLLDALPRARVERIVFLVGPEGGFTDVEVANAVAAGFQPIRLGPTILRIETAALACAAACLLRYPPDR